MLIPANETRSVRDKKMTEHFNSLDPSEPRSERSVRSRATDLDIGYKYLALCFVLH